MEKTLNQILAMLPDKKTFKKRLDLNKGENTGIHPCGDKLFGIIPIYKCLTREAKMVTYLNIGKSLYYWNSKPLHH